MTDVDLTLLQARSVLEAQPFSRLLGASLTRFGAGMAEVVIPLRDDLLQQFGFAHGGVLAYAADNALTFAGGSVLGPEILTRGVAIDYLRPARGERIRALAQVVSATSRQAVCRVDVFCGSDGVEDLCAAAQGTVNVTGRAS